MGLIKFAIDNPVKIAVASILLTLFGLLSIFEIPKQLTPDVDPPIITISTFWSGASPQEIASEIVERQEEKLKNITGLRKMSSESVENSGTITLEFDVGVDKDIALREASEKLRQVSGYPEEVDEPTISATDDDNSRTIAWLMLRGDESTDVSLLKTWNVRKALPRRLFTAAGNARFKFGWTPTSSRPAVSPFDNWSRPFGRRTVTCPPAPLPGVNATTSIARWGSTPTPSRSATRS